VILWRARCAERRTAGSEGGLRKRANRKVGTAPQSDPYKIEADAATLVCWEHTVLPGLLQTPVYASVLLHGNQEAVEARLARQSILQQEDKARPTHFVAMIDEQVLYRRVGTADTMKEQLEHLLDLSTLPNITVQVVLASGDHDGNSGAFMVATMEDRSEVAYVETAIRGIATDDPEDLSTLGRTLIALRSQTLPEEMSRELIRKAIEEEWS
jgi:hypothetical protein